MGSVYQFTLNKVSGAVLMLRLQYTVAGTCCLNYNQLALQPCLNLIDFLKETHQYAKIVILLY